MTAPELEEPEPAPLFPELPAAAALDVAIDEVPCAPLDPAPDVAAAVPEEPLELAGEVDAPELPVATLAEVAPPIEPTMLLAAFPEEHPQPPRKSTAQ